MQTSPTPSDKQRMLQRERNISVCRQKLRRRSTQRSLDAQLTEATLANVSSDCDLREKVCTVAAEPTTRHNLIRESWFRANLQYKLREDGQQHVYDAIEAIRKKHPCSAEPIVLNMHRRFGKTYLCLLRKCEAALRHPGQMLKYGGPTEKQCRSMAVPNLHLILEDCPPELRPKPSGMLWKFHNPAWGHNALSSNLLIVGCNEEQGNNLRGMASDQVCLDECRDIRNLDYIVKHVLSFQFVKREDPELLLISTPPKSPAHDFVDIYVKEAMRKGQYLVMPSSANKDWTKEDQEMILGFCGSKDSIAWRREAQCELVTDAEEMIVPEFLEAENDIVVDDYERPSHFKPMSILDTGWLDWNAVVYGYLDFLKQTLVVEDEVVARYKSTGEIAEAMRKKETALYPGMPLRRRGDLKEQALHDLRVDHRMYIQPVEKWDRDSAIAGLRTTVQRRKIKIHRRCRHLIFQLRNGIWNKQRTEFERSKQLGHCDALAALIYMHRVANWRENPYPDEMLFTNPETFHVPGSNAVVRRDGLLRLVGRLN